MYEPDTVEQSGRVGNGPTFVVTAFVLGIGLSHRRYSCARKQIIKLDVVSRSPNPK
jgi:hypothetical protein